MRTGLVIPDNAIGASYDPSALLTPVLPPGVWDGTIRNKTLNEGFDGYGRLIQLIGTDAVTNFNWTKHGDHYLSAPIAADRHAYDTVEVWDVYNATGDVHPIHFHLVNVQIIGRAPFGVDANGDPVFTPPAPLSGLWVPPDANERGYKETVRMNPGEITRVVMRLDRPPNPVVNVRGVNQTIAPLPSPRTGGHEYVFHCHILEHEEHDMMRPFIAI